MEGNYLSLLELRNFISAVRNGEVNELQFVALLAAMETSTQST